VSCVIFANNTNSVRAWLTREEASAITDAHKHFNFRLPHRQAINHMHDIPRHILGEVFGL
jgi:hypothetical protein